MKPDEQLLMEYSQWLKDHGYDLPKNIAELVCEYLYGFN